MNTHLQLLWNSVFAPKAAVDLAKQHPNTYNLGWNYVAALIVATLLCDIVALYVVRPLFGTALEQPVDAFAWADSLVGMTTISVIASVFLFIGQRWFWQKFEPRAELLPAVDAAIISGFALSLVILLPTYVVNETILNAAGIMLFLYFVLLVGVFLYFSTVYFSHGLGMTMTRSFGLNMLFFMLTVIFLTLLYFFSAIIPAWFLGTPLDSMFDVQDQAQ